MFYRRLTQGLVDRGTLIPADQNFRDYIRNSDSDYYLSPYKYTEEQKATFIETGTVAGMTDVVSDMLWWDFDSEVEPELARVDTIALVDRLIKSGIEQDHIAISFSGNKGFGVNVKIDEELPPKEIKDIAFKLAKDLKNFDVKVYNASRVLRIANTKHPKTGLYKITLSLDHLKESLVDDIMGMAKEPAEENAEFLKFEPVCLPEAIHKKGVTQQVSEITDSHHHAEVSRYLDYSVKPKFLTNCRWAIQNGHFIEGERNHALLCLASTYKNLGFNLEHVYRLLKGVAELQSKLRKVSRFNDQELYRNIVMQVFGPTWKNGQYTCREKGNWLETFCAKLEHPCNHKEEDELKPKSLIDIRQSFTDYVTRIDENTISTGLPTLDKHIFLSTGVNLGIIGAPGSGKTSLLLNILNNTSKAGVKSVFASLDMHRNRMFEKVLYFLSNMNRQQIYEMFKDRKEAALIEKVKEEFGNVYFFNKSSPTVEDLRNYIMSCQDATGEKVKLLCLDYFERVTSDVGDDTAASKRVAGELQDLVNDLDVALVDLVQPNKHAIFAGPDSPIYDYTGIKGSSFVYQSMRIIVSLWRPFYNPKTFQNDKFMQMAVLKNDLGELTEFAFKWHGSRGRLGEMEQYDGYEFERMLKEKQDSGAGQRRNDL